MKKLFYILLLINCFSLTAQEEEAQEVKNNETEKIEEFVDQDPTYPGGVSGFRNFLASNINYPQKAVNKNIQGKCYVSFVVDKNGNVIDVKIAKGIKNCKACNKEAMRVIKLTSGKWTPAKVNGNDVKYKYIQIIDFQL